MYYILFISFIVEVMKTAAFSVQLY